MKKFESEVCGQSSNPLPPPTERSQAKTRHCLSEVNEIQEGIFVPRATHFSQPAGTQQECIELRDVGSFTYVSVQSSLSFRARA